MNFKYIVSTYSHLSIMKLLYVAGILTSQIIAKCIPHENTILYEPFDTASHVSKN